MILFQISFWVEWKWMIQKVWPDHPILCYLLWCELLPIYTSMWVFVSFLNTSISKLLVQLLITRTFRKGSFVPYFHISNVNFMEWNLLLINDMKSWVLNFFYRIQQETLSAFFNNILGQYCSSFKIKVPKRTRYTIFENLIEKGAIQFYQRFWKF